MRALLAGTALTLLMGAPTALAIDVSSDADLRAAIEIARTTPNTTINLLNSITLTAIAGELPALQGTGTVINGNGNTLNGNNQFRGLLVYNSTASSPRTHRPTEERERSHTVGKSSHPTSVELAVDLIQAA
jgi:hypothetical protein